MLLAPNAGVPPPLGANAKVLDPALACAAPKLKPPAAGALGAPKAKPVLGPEEPNVDPAALAENTEKKTWLNGGKQNERQLTNAGRSCYNLI